MHGSLICNHAVAVRLLVEAFSIDTHAGCDNQPLNGMLYQGLEQHRGAHVVNARIVCNFVHALTYSDSRGQMINEIHIPQCTFYRRLVSNVSMNELYVRMKIKRPFSLI